jgi:hypothetical protein
VLREGALHLCRTDAVARHVDDVIHAPRDPIVPVRVAAAAVAREVIALRRGEVVGISSRFSDGLYG